jgi:cation:H+ antiporter
LWLSLAFIVGGLVALVWSADAFIDAAGRIARRFGVSPFVVGMVIIGFGTSAPELAVSVLSGLGGHSNLSLGNAYGSSIFNIAVILGLTALVKPIKVKPAVVWFAVPLLTGIAAISWWLVRDGSFERANGILLLIAFAVLLPIYCWYDQKNSGEGGADVPAEAVKVSVFTWLLLLVGLGVLIMSSHILVWGCVDFARDVLHVSDLMIGLTVVAMGTSLPELASAVVSARKGEHEFVIGNIVGSNFFNMLGVVGVAGTLSPFDSFSRFIVVRDLPLIAVLSLSLALFGVNFRSLRRQGEINRFEGVLWLLVFAAYLAVIISQESGV